MKSLAQHHLQPTKARIWFRFWSEVIASTKVFAATSLVCAMVALAIQASADDTLSATLEAPSQAPRAELVEAASHSVANEPLIRVYVSPAPGFGHQAATMSVMRRLRQIGFQGVFEVVYENSTASKLVTLVPGFEPSKTGWQSFEHQGMKLISLSEFAALPSVSRVKLGITGAEDQRGFMTPEKLGVESYLRLQPLEWGSSELMTRTSSKEIVIPGLNGLGFHVDIIDSPEVVRTEILAMRFNSNLGGKTEGLKELFARTDVVFGTIYGVGLIGNMSGRLKIWTDAIRSVQRSNPESFQNGIILPMLSGLNEVEVRNLKWDLGLNEDGTESRPKRGQPRLRFIDIRDPGSAKAIHSVGKGDVLLVQIGSVPQVLFEILFSRSRLPLLLAGKNALNLAQNLGKPYINTVGDYSFETSSKFSAASQRVLTLAAQAFHYSLDSVSHKRGLTRFISESMSPETEIARLFSSRMRPNRDKVAEAIFFWSKVTGGNASSSLTPRSQPGLNPSQLRSCSVIFGGL